MHSCNWIKHSSKYKINWHAQHMTSLKSSIFLTGIHQLLVIHF